MFDTPTLERFIPNHPLGLLNEEVLFILGIPCFQAAPIADLLRRSGRLDVPCKAEKEQAVVIYWLLNLYHRYQGKWREQFGKEVDQMNRLIDEKKQAELSKPIDPLPIDKLPQSAFDVLDEKI
jgi:hypothetical protein